MNASFTEDVHTLPQNLQPVEDSQPEAEPDATIADGWLSRLAMVGILIGVTMTIISILALIRDKNEQD